MKYFGTDGIRGKAEMFTGEFLEKIVRGLGVEGKRVLIGGDTRESTKHILENLERSLKNNGAKEVGNIGVFPTPGINNVFYSLVYDFAIDVTASHNPYTDNGIKIFEYADGSGIKLNEEGRERIEKELASDSPFELKVPDVETEFFDEKARGLEYYKNHLRDYLGTTDLSGLRVTLDCANGATGIVGGSVFEELGAEVEVENNDTDFGRKINDGVGSTHLEGLQEKVRSGEFNLGAAFDGDGDRCMLVDEKGELVDGDQILVILANFLHLDKIAGTVMANQGLLNWGKEHGVEVITTDVGDQNVAAAMREQDIKIGGEQSGHIILPREAMGDGMLTALMAAKAMKETGRPLSDLAGEMKKFPQTMLNVPASHEEKEMLKTSEAVKSTIAEFSERLNAVHGRLLVRPSGTEDLVRITLWGEEQEKIDLLANELAEKLTEEFKNGRN
ncbi:phosphoglucosamine mutase [Candidatus Saccharibacteria bacterium]|nr:phosphoglucosamine mutase [Candidatus Saccharibacteria bacterium]